MTFRGESLGSLMLPEHPHGKSPCLVSGSKCPVWRTEYLCASGGMFPGSPHKQKIVWGWDGEVGDEPRRLGPESFEGGSQWLLLLAGSVIILVIPNPYGQENKSILEMRKLRTSKMNFCTTGE